MVVEQLCWQDLLHILGGNLILWEYLIKCTAVAGPLCTFVSAAVYDFVVVELRTAAGTGWWYNLSRESLVLLVSLWLLLLL